MRSSISELLRVAEGLPGCLRYPRAGVPAVPDGLSLPNDLIEFYGQCGGLLLFAGAVWSMTIVRPVEFVSANLVIVGQDCPNDISHSWFIVGSDPPQYVTIDLSPSRLGHCYESFWDCHGLAGSCARVAFSFTDFLAQVIAARWRELYWLSPEFRSLGDAYDAPP